MCYNVEMGKKICFIGHRNVNDLSIRKKLKDIIEIKINNGYKYFLMGTHGEFDKLALSVCRELREIYKDIIIEVIITSLNAVKKRLIYNDCFGKEYYTPYDDVITTMFDIEEEYFKNRIIISNRKMIESCEMVVCYVDNKQTISGAKLAFNYAKKKNLDIINLYSNDITPALLQKQK